MIGLNSLIAITFIRALILFLSNFSIFSIVTTTATAQTKLYFTDNGTDRVSSSDLDGSNLLTLVQLSLNPIGIAVDAQNQKVYFVADGAIIQSVDASGGNPTTILDANDGLISPVDVAVDGSKLYFTDNGTDRVSSSDVDGSNVLTLVQLSANPRGIAVDAQNQRVYFAVEGPSIQWVDAAGGTSTTILDANDGLQEPIDLVVDSFKLYFTDNGTDRVSSSDLDGSNLLTLVQLSVNPIGIAVDAQNQKVYFVADGAIIQSVDASGGNPTTILDAGDGLQQPLHLAIPAISPVGVKHEIVGQPAEFSLYQNYPNPFNPQTVITYTLPKAGEVSLIVFDIRGKRVTHLFSGFMPAGIHQVIWDASNLTSGIYFYRLKARQTDVGQAVEFVQTRKMLLLQ